VRQFSYNSKKIEFYDETQGRDSSGKWASGGGSGGGGSAEEGKESLSETTTVYHGTTADVLGKIKESGIKPSRDGVYGKGVYATDNQRLALEYGCLKAPQANRIGGKVLLGIVEVTASGFKNVHEQKGDKDGYKVFLSEKGVLPSAIKRMMIFDAKPVRKWIFEGGEKPKPIAVKNLEEGTIFVPILIDASDFNLEEEKCPVETQDIKANLANRQEAIDIAHYGPANPKEPNEDYWKAKAGIFKGSVEEAKTMRCGNCAGFNQTSKLIDCITKGIGINAKEVEQAGDLGFCEIFDFKCASLRTCDAWIVGGPITDKTNLEQLNQDLLALKADGTTLLYDPSQARDESGKWGGGGGGGSSLSDKLSSRIQKESPSLDIKNPNTQKVIKAVASGVENAKIAVQYGASKVSDIKNWMKSDSGKEFIKGTTKALGVVSKGVVEAGKEFHNQRFGILVSAIVGIPFGPTLAIEHGGYALLKGFVRGAVAEYKKDGGGRSVSNAIRSKIGVERMQACGNIVSLQQEPSEEDLINYLTDVLAVSIRNKIKGEETFQVESFAYDPSQARGEGGKWTSGGGTAIANEPEQGMPIYDEDENPSKQPIGTSGEELTQSEKIEKELKPDEQEYAQEFMQVIGPPKREKNLKANSEEYKQDVVGWSKAFAENKVDKEEAIQMAQSLHTYAGGKHAEINKSIRDMDTSEFPDLESMAVADSIVSAMEVAPKIKENVIWRGTKSGSDSPLGESYTHQLAKTAKVGQVMEDNGILSCSFNESVGKEFSNWGVGNKGVQSKVLMKVKNANGVGVKMPSFASSFINEKEVLLRPETKLKITSVKRSKEPVNALFRGEDTHVYHTEIEAEIVK